MITRLLTRRWVHACLSQVLRFPCCMVDLVAQCFMPKGQSSVARSHLPAFSIARGCHWSGLRSVYATMQCGDSGEWGSHRNRFHEFIKCETGVANCQREESNEFSSYARTYPSFALGSLLPGAWPPGPWPSWPSMVRLTYHTHPHGHPKTAMDNNPLTSKAMEFRHLKITLQWIATLWIWH